MPDRGSDEWCNREMVNKLIEPIDVSGQDMIEISCLQHRYNKRQGTIYRQLRLGGIQFLAFYNDIFEFNLLIMECLDIFVSDGKHLIMMIMNPVFVS